MELHVLLEYLKLILWTVFAIARYYVDGKREKAMIATLEKYNRRLKSLEKKNKEIP